MNASIAIQVLPEVKNIDYDGSAWGGWAFGQEFDSPHLH